ncbi:MAG: 1-acyl-sn-glycerol-3-phosphate acyltransferase, partial [Clostridia bacterium]|nr:1-acyl-sn-glycerol-3-phosphate acyltransferase [Clostridia bacterium]
MSLKHVFIGKEKFDTRMKPWKIPWYFRIAEYGFSIYWDIIAGIKLRKINMKGMKYPCIVLQNHASFVDFALVAHAVKPHVTGYVASIEEFNRSEWLIRSLGAMYKRKFTADVTVIKHILYMLKTNKTTVTIFPEARFSLAGITEETDSASYARLIKIAKVPVVVGIGKGIFVRSPQWSKHPYRNIPVQAEYKQIITAEETETLSLEEIKKRIDKNFLYDDYRYWQQSGKKIKCKERAKNIHKILYKCPHCGAEFKTDSKGTEIWCNECGHRWELTETGFLKAVEGETYFDHVPDWYRWERAEVEKEVAEGRYKFEDVVRVEELQASKKGFVPIGNATLTHDENGFTLKGVMNDGKEISINRRPETMYS